MKEKISHPGNLEVRQDHWPESPCSRCSESPCCRNLPLAPFYLEERNDFVNLTLISCYNGVFPAMKKSGEWTIFLERDCRFLDIIEGKCSIFNTASQSLICKSYNAHNCWYLDAFSTETFTSMIPFNTEMIIWFDKKYGLLSNDFKRLPWEELCAVALEYLQMIRERNTSSSISDKFETYDTNSLSFKKSRLEQNLFFPPYKRPERREHFELISFRLGFPGVYLAVSDNCWAYLVKTELNAIKLTLFREEYFPGIAHKDGRFSFTGLMKDHHPFTEAGETWVILHGSELEILKGLVKFDSSGSVLRLPTSREILAALRRGLPDKAA